MFVLPLQLMAYHSWSQPNVVLAFVPLVVASVMSSALVVRVADAIGIHRTYITGMIGHFVIGLPERLLIVTSPKICMWTAAFHDLFSGRDIFTTVMEQWLYDAKDSAKVMNLQQLVGYGAAALSSHFYSWTFDAKSVTYADQVAPNLVMIVVEVLKVVGFFSLLWSMDGGRGGYQILLRESGDVNDKIRRKCNEIFLTAIAGNGALTDSALRNAGYTDIFNEWLDAKDLEVSLEFTPHDDLFKAVKGFYSGKRLPE